MKSIIIDRDKYIIAKTKKIVPLASVFISGREEITAIIKEKFINKDIKKEIIKSQRGYRLIKFDIILPFNLVGFIAKISQSLAEENIPILVISAYSTDYILIKDKHLKKAIAKLKSLGFNIKK